jgi:hypothetical protein
LHALHWRCGQGSTQLLTIARARSHPAVGLPTQWGGWGPALKTFGLKGSGCNGPLPPTWSAWSALESLQLSGLALTGTLPAEWTAPSAFPNLRELELSAMPGLTAANWAALHDWLLPKAPRLQRLALAGLRGVAGVGLDPMFGSFTNLTTLVLANMSLGGPVPAAWSSLPTSKLWALDLSGNGLSGGLPDWAVGAMAAPPPGVVVVPPPPGGWYGGGYGPNGTFGRPNGTANGSYSGGYGGYGGYDGYGGYGSPETPGAYGSMLPPGMPYAKGWLLDLSRNNFTGGWVGGWVGRWVGGGGCMSAQEGPRRGPQGAAACACWRHAGAPPPTAHRPGPALPLLSLAGPLPPAWGAATLPPNSGHAVRLGSNGLQGSFPLSWQALVYRAAVFEVQSNQLNGEFPPSWWNASVPANEGPGLLAFNIRCACEGGCMQGTVFLGG